jgi:hypothetical protein
MSSNQNPNTTDNNTTDNNTTDNNTNSIIRDSNEITFYFFRHGYSCFNIYKDKTIFGMVVKYKSDINKDPHLTNWGILASILSGKYLKSNKNFNNIKFEKSFVSPLIRTWETAACMFTENEYIIGSYLREGRPSNKSQKYSITTGASDIPYSYNDNLKRFDEFKNFLFEESKQKSFKYILNELNKNSNDKYIFDQIDKINKINIIFPNNNKYNNKHLLKGNLEMFMLWVINNYPNLNGNVLVICHGTLILKDFIKKYLDQNKYNNIKDISHNNNFGFKVKVEFNKNNYTQNEIKKNNKENLFKIINIEKIFSGIKKPYIKNELVANNLRRDCSLCTNKIDKCKIKLKEKNLETHMMLLKKPNDYIVDKKNSNNTDDEEKDNLFNLCNIL